MRTAHVYVNHIAAGTLKEDNDGSFSFYYNDDYLHNSAHSSICLSLPKTQKEHHSKTLFPFFFNMLSEGVNKRIQVRRFGIDEEDDFGLLMATAHSDVIGAITIKKTEV
jgi:serine/threonine-protein kinase HipA